MKKRSYLPYGRDPPFQAEEMKKYVQAIRSMNKMSSVGETGLPVNHKIPFPSRKQNVVQSNNNLSKPVQIHICNPQAHLLMNHMTFVLLVVSVIGCFNAIVISETRNHKNIHVKFFAVAICMINIGIGCIILGWRWQQYLPLLANTCYFSCLIILWLYATIVYFYIKYLYSSNNNNV